MKLFLVIVLIATFYSLSTAILLTSKTFSECTKKPTIKWINLTSCLQEPCNLRPGQNGSVISEFVSLYDVEGDEIDSCTLTIKVKKWLFWFEVLSLDLCDHVNCHLKKGDVMRIDEFFVIPEKVPSIVMGNAAARFNVVCEGNELSCASVNFRLTDEGSAVRLLATDED